MSVVRDHCLAPERSDAPIYGGRYRRLFDHLPALEPDEQALHALGRPGGPCDVGVDYADSEDAAVAAVWPFFGQFIAHDITADRSPIGHRGDADAVRNFRTPRANLEGVYGAGPVGSPYLFERDDPTLLLLGPGASDVPRNHQGIALVGDPRNDVHLFMNQIQVAFLRMHNRLVRRLREDNVADADVFEEARRAATWHYQHVILHEFLPLLVGTQLTESLLSAGPQSYDPGEQPFIPFEFADAAYRYGHSQIRQRYQVNSSFGPVPVFPDLIGFQPVSADRAVEWELHVDVPGGPRAQRAKKIDGRLPESLIALPLAISGEQPDSEYASLANRDLQRGVAVGLPSGEAVARELGVEPLAADAIGLDGWQGETPLWWYILRESAVLEAGEQLGPVGGRIVGEVLVGIIDADPESFRSVDRGWTPTLPSHVPGSFGLADILAPAPE